MPLWLGTLRDWVDSIAVRGKAETIVAEYGKIIGQHPGAYIDENWLPATKRTIKAALKRQWKAARSDAERQAILLGWSLLASFQRSVGQVPLTVDISDATTFENAVSLDRYEHFAALARAEGEANDLELRAFLKRLDA